MFSVLISTVKTDLSGMVHGTSLDTVKNLSEVFNRVARTLLSKVDPPETIRIGQITNAVHDDIYDYDVQDDLKGTKIIDLRPQVNRDLDDSFSQRFSRTFDKYKRTGTFQVRYDNDVKTLRLSAAITPVPTTIHGMNSLTANGTWVVGGDATNLTLDENNYMSGSGCLNFDLTGDATTGYIENTALGTSVDLEDEEDIGKIFVRVYIPDTSIITNFILRWGSSASAYWSATVTSPHDQSDWKTGWQILAFDWNGAMETGSPDSSAIDYLRLTVTVSSATAETDLRVDKITCSSGSIFEIEYYSNYLFTNSAGTLQQKTSADEDYLILDDDAYQIYLHECVIAISQQKQGANAAFDYRTSKEILYGDGSRDNVGLYPLYKKHYPSQALKPREFYWRWNTYNS